LDGAVFPQAKADSVEKLSPAATLPFVFSSVKRMKREGKMHLDPDKLSSKQPSKVELEKEGDTWGIRYDESLSFPIEVAIWRKNGETTVITYSKFRKMDEATSRTEIQRILAPIRKEKKR
jgi:hypothetical protein